MLKLLILGKGTWKICLAGVTYIGSSKRQHISPTRKALAPSRQRVVLK